MSERFIVDDAGTLIDMVSRDTYDYVDDVCPVLNNLSDEINQLKKAITYADDLIDSHTTVHVKDFWENYCKQHNIKIKELDE